MEASPSVYTGRWADHTKAWQLVYTVTDPWYTFWNLVTGVVFGLGQPYFERIIGHVLSWIWFVISRPYAGDSKQDSQRSKTAAHNEDPDERTQFLNDEERSQGREDGNVHILPNHRASDNESATRGQEVNEDGGRDQNEPSQGSGLASLNGLRSWLRTQWKVFAEAFRSLDSWGILLMKLISVAIIVVAIGWSVASAFVTNIPKDTAALIESDQCGAWGLRETDNPEALDNDALQRGKLETRAGQYAKDCYPPRSDAPLDQCELFKSSYIRSDFFGNQPCPFEDKTYCDGTGVTAAKFTTGLVEATELGLNTAKPPKFNRTTICVPLNLRDRRNGGPEFVENTRGGKIGYWGYKLGRVEGSNYTFEQEGDPWDYDVRSYTMSTYAHFYSRNESDNYWHPPDALNIKQYLKDRSDPYSMTIMFINSCRLYYEENSVDPIFPADYSESDDTYTNSDSRARPLVCIDWIETYPHGEKNPQSPYDGDSDVDADYVFMRFALQKSSTYYSIVFRGAMGLDAQYKIEDDTSLPLHKEPTQWIFESWNMFKTSLARAQYNALDIATGVDSDGGELYEPKMKPRWMNGKLCHKLMIQIPKGYNNIRVGPQVLLTLIPVFVFILGIKTTVEYNESIKKCRPFKDRKMILGELILWTAAEVTISLVMLFFNWVLKPLWARMLQPAWKWLRNITAKSDSSPSNDPENAATNGSAQNAGPDHSPALGSGPAAEGHNREEPRDSQIHDDMRPTDARLGKQGDIGADSGASSSSATGPHYGTFPGEPTNTSNDNLEAASIAQAPTQSAAQPSRSGRRGQIRIP